MKDNWSSKLDRILSGKKIYIVALVVTCLYYYLESYIDKKNLIDNSASIRSKNSIGSLLVYDYLKNTNREVSFTTSAYSRIKDLDKFDVIGIFNPAYSLSKLEETKLRDYIYEGGHLILNIDGKRAPYMFRSLLRKIKLSLSIVEDEDFKNLEIRNLSNAKYSASFYGLHNFKDCVVDKFGCFFYEKNLGKGRVSIILGMSPFSNLMLQQEGNLEFLEALLGNSKTIAIDEFHQYFGTKTFWDILDEPKLFVTILVIFLVVIVYFVFSYVPEEILTKEERDKDFPNIHNFTVGLINGVDEKSITGSLLKKHRSYLKREFDLDETLVNSKGTAKQLIKLHKEQLEKKGRRNGY